ncbi:MAG: molybdopterin molybdotransferase MoeA [Chloroflexi bacterium]|nr:molybdopterin molybdotransferase MoeA [Chloroflexota bacterium]
MTESKYPMIPVEEAQQIVLAHVAPLPAEDVPFDEALDRVLAEDVYAGEDMPPFAASAKDGFAVRAADGVQPRRLLGEQMAGLMATLHVEPGTAVRITTGAPVPPGADAVIMVEYTTVEGDTVRLSKAVQPGDDVRPPGQDIVQGQLVLPAGTAIGPAEIGLLATVGQVRVPVYARPRVATMSTGDELVEPGETPAPGQIRDSNRYTLAAAAHRAGATVVDLGHAPDTAEALTTHFGEGLAHADVVVTSGGVSMGELDLVKPLLEEIGTVHFGRVHIKPGFATVDGKPFFALPGFPVSSLVAFEVFVRPALRKMAGFRELFRPRHHVTLRHDVRHSADRPEFARAIVEWEDGRLFARTTGFQGSGRLLSLVGANALLALPHGRGDFRAGEKVEALLIG